MRHEVRVPDFGGAASEAFVAEWLKQEGDPVAAGEDLLELITDKANVAVVAPAAGTLAECHAAAEQRVEPGDLLAVVEDGE